MASELGDLTGKIVIEGVNQSGKALQEAGKGVEEYTGKSTKALDKLTETAESNAKKREAAEKRATQITLQQSRERIAQLNKEAEQAKTATAKARRETPGTVRAKSEGRVAEIKARGERDLTQTFAQRENNRLQALYRLDQTAFEENEKRKTKAFSDQLRVRREEYRKDIKALGPMSQQLQNAINASIGTSNAAYMLGMQAQASGMTPTQIWQQRMNAATARGNAANAAALTTPAFGPPARGGGGRGGGNVFTRLLGGGGGGIAGSIASGLLGGLGVGIGGYAIANIAQGVGADVDRATAYERQTVAARNLAGSQAKLNELLAAYATASGNAIDKTTTLSNVTRLMATGFADSAPEVEKFVRATRGASIALGRPQDYVIQETQLAISNISVKRLDQIGLGISEVNERIEQLRKTNAGWTRETAFQDAVITLLDEKYGKLTKTAEGQATGVEKLRKAWADLRLEMGQAAKGPVESAAGWFANILDGIAEGMDRATEQHAKSLEEARRQDLKLLTEKGFLGISLADIIGQATGRTATQVAAGALAKTSLLDSYTQPLDAGQMAATYRKTGRFNDDQQAVVTSFYERGIEMERNYQEQRTAEIERYESQRLSIVQNYGKMMVREEEDFARQRARGLEDYERSIVKIIKDAQERESEMREALAERVADAREDHEKRVSDIQEKYQEDREKALKDHRDRLMKAAGQLDAIAVLEERKRWKKENEEREEGYKDALEKAQENLDEQVEKANEAHEKQLEKARKADADRLAEMAENRRIQLEREDEDRAIRLERLQQDHNDQLAELDRLHAETLAKMDRRFYEETKAFEEELAVALAAVGVYIDGVAEKEQRKREAEEKWVDGMIEKYEGRLRAMENGYSYDPKTGPNIPLDYGKYLNETAPLAASSSHTSTSRNSTLVINEGAFSIYGAAGQSPAELAQEVESIVIGLMEDY